MMKKAFTMIELIFVIVVMGILAKFGFEFLAQAYNSFIYTKINSELHARSDHALEFIAKRLEARVAPSTIKRISSINGFVGVTANVANMDQYNLLEWISYDIDGYRGVNAPFWSGIIDFDTTLTTTTQLHSPNTNFTAIDNLVISLSDDNATIADIAIIFTESTHQIDRYGWYAGAAVNDHSLSIHPVTLNANDTFTSTTATDFTNLKISNRYMLTWTACAIFHDAATDELWFHYNYQPWDNERYDEYDKGVKRELIMENVSDFRIYPSSDGKLFSIKVCIKSELTNEEHAICKEKTIF